MINPARLLVLLLAVLGAAPLHAQAAPEQQVRAVIDRLFDGMRAGDSTAVRSVFHPVARMVTTGTRDAVPVLQTSTVDQFVRAVGTPHPARWDERIWNVQIRTRDNLATAWMDYAFFLGDQLSHCGVNAFELFRGPDGWKVIGVSDTRQRQGCTPPPAG